MIDSCLSSKANVVNRYTYLEIVLSSAVHNDDEVNNKTAEASVVFGGLHGMSVIEVVSGWIQSCMSIMLQYCRHSYIHVRSENLPASCLKT